MSSFVVRRGATFLAPYNDVLHLFVVMSDPDAHGECLLLMITSIKPKKKHDPTCEINVGDHQFITHPSYVLYRMADTGFVRHITNMISKNLYVPRTDIEPAVLKRMTDGVYASDETRGRIIKFAQRAGI